VRLGGVTNPEKIKRIGVLMAGAGRAVNFAEQAGSACPRHRWLIVVAAAAAFGMTTPAAWGSAETPAYLGSQGRLTLDRTPLADRANVAVDVANGNLVVTGNDVRIAGRGLGVVVSRTYNARGSGARRSFGRNWVSSLGADSTLTIESDGDRTWRGPTGQELRFDKQADGSFVTPPGVNATLVLNDDGTAKLTENPSGTKYAYDASSPQRLTKVTDRNGNHIDLSYGPNGISTITDTQGRDLTFAHNPAGDLTSVTDPTGRVWGYGYDGDHNLTSYTDPEGKQWLYHYDSSGRLDTITDPRSHDTKLAYDTTDRVTSLTRVVDGTVANDVTTGYAYAAASSPCGASASTKTTMTDPRGKTTIYCADGDRQVTKTRNALGEDEDKHYTPNGDTDVYTDQAQSAGSAGATTLSFDTTGTNPTYNLTGGSKTTGEAFSIGYDASLTGSKYLPRSSTDPQGSDTFFGYDTAGNVTTVKDSDTTSRNEAVLDYNADGTLASATDGEGHQTTFDYFASGNLKQINPPSPMGPTSYTYDALSRVATITWPNGESAIYSYDKLDRVTRIDYGEANDPHNYQFTYDADGNLTERTDNNPKPNTTTWSYDQLNRRVEDDLPEGYTFTYAYDKASNYASVTGSGGIVDDVAFGTVSYTYDDINRVKTIVSPNASGSATDTIGYDYADTSDPRAVTATLPSGVTERAETDLSGKTTKIVSKTSGGSVIRSRSYDYADGSAQRTLIQSVTDENANKTAYAYKDASINEDVGRLLKARTETGTGALVEQYAYAYDKAGNRTSKTHTTPSASTTTSYAYNHANELCWSYAGSSSADCSSPPSGATAFSYDDAGNQLTGDHTITYQHLNRTDTVDGQQFFFQYLSPTQDDMFDFAGTRYVPTLLGLSHESPFTNIIRNPTSGQAVAERRDTLKSWMLHDQLGSTIGLLNQSGSVKRSYSYTPDGQDTATGNGPDTDIRFTGGVDIDDVALYHFGARYYDPQTARWTQADPLLHNTSIVQANRYEYAADDPSNLTDPSGLCPVLRCSTYGHIFATAADVGDRLAEGYTTAEGCVASLALGPAAPLGCGAVATGDRLAHEYLRRKLDIGCGSYISEDPDYCD
jgi:RHS repeat-associated protein